MFLLHVDTDIERCSVAGQTCWQGIGDKDDANKTSLFTKHSYQPDSLRLI